MCPECMRGFLCGECNIPAPVAEEEEEDLDSTKTRRYKPDSSLKDQQSTGRKRAAKLYPLDRLAFCEWYDATMESPKGGGLGITFSCNAKQQARHHGPDKNTLNNDPTNVHRICHVHHNNWHAINDLDYDWSKHNKPRRD